MLIHTTTYNNLKVEFYINDIPGSNPGNTIRIRMDTTDCGVQCYGIGCISCPLNAEKTATYTSINCAERGIDYFQKVTKDQFPEWSV